MRRHPRRRRTATRLLAGTVAVGLAAGAAAGIAATTGGGSGSPGSSLPRPADLSGSVDSPGGNIPIPDEGLRVSTRGWSTDFTAHSVPLSEFAAGGPGKDGIPAIDEPAFTSVAEADATIGAREPVIVLDVDGDVRVYPIQILIWHEIVNDVVGGVPIVVTFCPLCNTALAFERTLDGEVLDFGTTGNLRNSDLVMFDRQTESWWQQFGGEAVVGELTGKTLTQVPATIVAWESVVESRPDAKVLSRDTGFIRSYGSNPYVGYDSVDSPPFFDVSGDDSRLAPKERVVFFENGDEAVAVPLRALAEAKELDVDVGGRGFVFTFVEGAASALDDAAIASSDVVGSAEVRDPDSGELVPFDLPFWFAVASFRPDTRIVTG